MRTLLAPLALSLALVAACGGGPVDPRVHTDAGETALAQKDYDAALEEFGAALDAIGDDASHALYEKARLGSIHALAHVNPEAAQEQFLALRDQTQLDANDYSNVANELASAMAYPQAVTVTDAGIKAHPEHPGLAAVLDNLKAKAEEDPSLKSALSGLGYL